VSNGPSIPIGEPESQRLEFKAPAALERPDRIAREVVGMLNADGGEIWIGLREEAGRAVGLDLISAAERARQQLHDSLVDLLSPNPDHQEVKVEVVSLPDGGDRGLLRIDVAPRHERQPYALVRGASFTFVIRVGSLLRPMDRGEVFKGGGSGESDPLREAQQRIRKEKDRFNSSRGSGLWLRVQPVPALDLDPTDPIFSELASDPHLSGNRRFGSFAISRKAPAVRVDHVRWGMEQSLDVRFDHDGGATFKLTLDLISMSQEGSESTELDPLRLAEYSVSGLRIARVVYSHFKLAQSGLILTALALVNQGSFLLREGSPGPLFSHGQAAELASSDAEAGARFPASEFLDHPDRCGFRLLRLLYQAFGMAEDAMPDVFDRKTGRLILPE